MNYRRALLVVEGGEDPRSALALLRAAAPEIELLSLVPIGKLDPSWLASLRELCARAAPVVREQILAELRSDAIETMCRAEAIDLIVFGSRTLATARVILTLRRRVPIAIAWAGKRSSKREQLEPRELRELVCVALHGRAQAAIGAFLRIHGQPSMRVALLSPSVVGPEVLASFLPVTVVEVSSPRQAPSLLRWLLEWLHDRHIDLLVFAGLPSALLGALLLGTLRATPVLVVPPLSAMRPPGQRAIDVADVVDDGGPLRVRVDQIPTVGSLTPLPDQSLVFTSRGRVVAKLSSERGQVELPADLELASLGVYRTASAPPNPVVAIEQGVAVIGPGERRWLLFDPELEVQHLQALAALARAAELDVLAVRLRPTHSCRSIRERLRAEALAPVVVDARAVLDEGEALDVSDITDPIRLARVAAKLRRGGFRVVALVHRGPHRPWAEGVLALSEAELELDPEQLERVVSEASRPGPLPSAALLEGNRIEIELDNEKARKWLLEAIAGSTETLHLQVYMGLDDEIGGAVEQALAAAGARGVKVRVLVDSLHGFHGSFGTRNPLFERISVRPGVELRALRPITELPSITDLKQRDHRKVVVADGRLALLGGRNLSHEYYTGFDEVSLSPSSTWREVPWLDAGARVEGPAVGALARGFLDAWCEAGGSPFEVDDPPPVGSAAARVIVHRGLREASTLELYRELIESARSHVYVVNGFPLALELQHVLLRALRRGIRVRTLFGNLTPKHEGQPFGGPWSTARTTATELVHSRMDPIVAAGGEGYVFARRNIPGWAPELGVVHPHVHAKVLSADGRRCTVGSANLDITASYWESELVLLVEDGGIAGELERRIDGLMAASTRVDREDPAWQQQAKRRAWMRHWPGVLSA